MRPSPKRNNLIKGRLPHHHHQQPVYPQGHAAGRRHAANGIEKFNIDIDGKETAEKVATLRKLREEQYEKLIDAVYLRRGWTPDGIPTLETVKRLGIDFPEIVELLQQHGVK